MRGWKNTGYDYSPKQRAIVALVLNNYLNGESGTQFWDLYQKLQDGQTPQALQSTLHSLEKHNLTYRDAERMRKRESAVVYPTPYLLENYKDLGFDPREVDYLRELVKESRK